jgi:hypothetical protein
MFSTEQEMVNGRRRALCLFLFVGMAAVFLSFIALYTIQKFRLFVSSDGFKPVYFLLLSLLSHLLSTLYLLSGIQHNCSITPVTFALDSVGFIFSSLFLVCKVRVFVNRRSLDALWGLLILVLAVFGAYRVLETSKHIVSPPLAIINTQCHSVFGNSLTYRIPLFVTQLLLYVLTSAFLTLKLRAYSKGSLIPLAKQLEIKSFILTLASFVLWTIIGLVPLMTEHINFSNHFFLLYFRQCIFGGLLLYSSVVKPQIA